MKNPLYIVDASNWFYKFSSAYHLTKTINNVEVNVSTLFGLYRSIKNNRFTNIVFALDGTPKASLNLLPSYKGQRNKDELSQCRVPFNELVKFLSGVGKLVGKNVFVALSPGQEADQVISSIVHIVSGEEKNYKFISTLEHSMNPIESDKCFSSLKGYKFQDLDLTQFDSAIISTTDSDMYQLKALKDVYIDGSTNGTQIDYSDHAPQAVYNLNPSCIPAYKMLCGDTSDNVPKLDLKMKKEAILELVSKFLNSKEKVNLFIEACKLDKVNSLDPLLRELCSTIIETNQVNDMERNYKVVALKFFSEPLFVEFPGFNIVKMLTKYGIRR